MHDRQSMAKTVVVLALSMAYGSLIFTLWLGRSSDAAWRSEWQEKAGERYRGIIAEQEAVRERQLRILAEIQDVARSLPSTRGADR